MEEDLNRAVPAKTRIKKIGFYVGLFLVGFLLAAFAGQGIDALKKTANLAGQTTNEAWAPNSNSKTIARIPLKSAPTKPKPVASAKNTKSSYTPVVAAVSDTKKDMNTPVGPEISATASATSGEIIAQSATSQPAIAENTTSPEIQQPAPVNSTAPVINFAPIPTQSSGLNHLVIAEIQISGSGGTENNFIKFGNPSSANLDISGWRIRKRTKTGTESSIRVIPDGTVVGAGATIIWANNKNNFAANMGAQITSSATISKDNSVAIFDSNGSLVDAAAWGGGAGQFLEGSPYSANPDTGQILKRKIQNGTWQDTENNSIDFFI